MGRDGFGDARLDGLLLDHDEYHGACQVCSAAIQKYVVLFSRLDIHEVTVSKPIAQFSDGFGRDGDQTFLGALAEYADVLLVEKQVAEFQIDQFADAQATTEQHFDDGSVAVAFPF